LFAYLASLIGGRRFRDGLINPNCVRKGLDKGGFFDEAFRVGKKGGIEDRLALSQGGLGQPIMDGLRGEECDAGVMMVVVVIVEEELAKGACI